MVGEHLSTRQYSIVQSVVSPGSETKVCHVDRTSEYDEAVA